MFDPHGPHRRGAGVRTGETTMMGRDYVMAVLNGYTPARVSFAAMIEACEQECR